MGEGNDVNMTDAPSQPGVGPVCAPGMGEENSAKKRGAPSQQ